MSKNNKPFVKITIEDLNLAKDFFENTVDYIQWLYAVTEYYQGNEVTIKKKIVLKYFNNYKKTMDFIIQSKETGYTGYIKKVENQIVSEQTLEGVVEEVVEPNNKLEINNKKINIEERKINFANSLKPFLDEYGKDMLNDFYGYWTEPTQTKNPKLKFELEKTWDVSRRLANWKKQSEKFNPKQPEEKKFKFAWQ